VTKAKADFGTIPLAEVDKVIAIYRRAVAVEQRDDVTKRERERILQRLIDACDEVRAASEDAYPEDDEFGDEIFEVERARLALRAKADLANLRPRRKSRSAAVEELEARIVTLYVNYGGAPTTYDSRRYIEPVKAAGKRGGAFAKVLLAVYERAGISAPADLTPILRGLADRAKHTPSK
jgi:hypothetical protein